MKHILHKCNDACTGGLSWCKICNGAEGSLPTDCPGRKMTQEEADKVYSKQLDYKNNEWIRCSSDRLYKTRLIFEIEIEHQFNPRQAVDYVHRNLNHTCTTSLKVIKGETNFSDPLGKMVPLDLTTLGSAKQT